MAPPCAPAPRDHPAMGPPVSLPVMKATLLRVPALCCVKHRDAGVPRNHRVSVRPSLVM